MSAEILQGRTFALREMLRGARESHRQHRIHNETQGKPEEKKYFRGKPPSDILPYPMLVILNIISVGIRADSFKITKKCRRSSIRRQIA